MLCSVDTNPIRRMCMAEAVYNGNPVYTGGMRVEYADGCAQQVSEWPDLCGAQPSSERGALQAD